MKEFYTVGEVAKLFNVSADTLRFYDRENIIKPWLVGENGYRYYSKAQFEMLSTIFLLAGVKTPLSEIKKIIHRKDTHLIEKELENCLLRIDRQIGELNQMKQSLELLASTIKDGCTGDEITEVRIPEIYMLLKEFSETDELDINEIIEANRQTESSWVSHAGVVSTADAKDILGGNYHKYKAYGYMSEFPCDTKRKDLLKVLKNTLFVCGNVKVTTVEHLEVDAVYEKMTAYIKARGYTLSGDVIERNIFDMYGETGRDMTIYFRIYMPVR